MRLTLPLLLMKNPKGHLFRGKYRLVQKVTKKAMDDLRFQWEQEERNMFLLRNPYLTKEETYYLKEIEKQPHPAVTSRALRDAKFERRRTLVDELSHLNIRQDWDFKGGHNF